jgi:hypothetical protein
LGTAAVISFDEISVYLFDPALVELRPISKFKSPQNFFANSHFLKKAPCNIVAKPQKTEHHATFPILLRAFCLNCGFVGEDELV